MSRTRRHRPYWVQAGEHGTDGFHQHELLGQPKTHWRKKRDERGRIITAPQPVSITLREASALGAPLFASRSYDKRLRAIRDEALRRIAAGEPWYARIDGPDTAEQPVYETHLLGHYVDYCTIDTPQDRDGRISGHSDLYAPCSRDLSHEDAAPAFGRTSGERRSGYNRDWRRPSRAKVRTAARELTKDADTWVEPDCDESGVLGR